MKKKFFGKEYSDYLKLSPNSLGHSLVPMFPFDKSKPYLLIDDLLPKYLQTILVQSLKDIYNVSFVKHGNDVSALFEVIEFQYHYQFKFKPEYLSNNNICYAMNTIFKFIDDWNNEYISHAKDMIIINKKHYESN